MSRVSVLLLLCGVLFVTRSAISEYQLQRMPAAHRRLASTILSRCRSVSDRLMSETKLCEAHTRRLAQSTRCRTLNVHLEMAEARLDRLDEFLMLRELESLQLYHTKCQDTSEEVRRLEAEKRELEQNIAELIDFLNEQEARHRAIVLETDALREEDKALDCEITRLDTERRMLEKQLKLQTVALDKLSGHEDETDLTSAMQAAAAERERAAEVCRQQKAEHQRRLASCQEQVVQVKAQLEAMPPPADRAPLEEELSTCREEAASCDDTTSSCAAELETASSQLLSREMAALAERGRLQGCQREQIANQGRFANCRSTGRQLVGRIRALQREARGGGASASRLEHCYADSSLCGSRAATCTEALNELRSGEQACHTETSEWRTRWQRCNDSLTGLEHDQLAPLQRTAKELEVQVNDTVTQGYQCEDDGLRSRADRGFAEEDLLRAQATLQLVKEQLDECQMGCLAGGEGVEVPEEEEEAGAEADITDVYDMSDW